MTIQSQPKRITHKNNDNTTQPQGTINIIMLRVNFCSDIWYCNILAYYLDNYILDTQYTGNMSLRPG